VCRHVKLLLEGDGMAAVDTEKSVAALYHRDDETAFGAVGGSFHATFLCSRNS
jgi:hypothetical protein